MKALAFILLVLVAACAAPTSTRTHFYDLSAEARARQGAGASGAVMRISVWQVSIPEMIDRNQMVIRLAPNRVEIADFHRWAEPLRRAIPRVLAEDLGRQLGAGYSVTAGQPPGVSPESRITVDVRRFDGALGEGVVVEAGWLVRPMKGGEPTRGRSLIEERAQGADHAALAAAFSRALARLSGDIAGAFPAQAAP